MNRTTTLHIENLSQIKKPDLEFGDLTVLVGPEATGKSIALQLLKLTVDAGQDGYGEDRQGPLFQPGNRHHHRYFCAGSIG